MLVCQYITISMLLSPQSGITAPPQRVNMPAFWDPLGFLGPPWLPLRTPGGYMHAK